MGRKRESEMGQMYLQRFAYRDGVSKSELDTTWGEAFKTFAQSGNWGGVDKGVTHHKTYGTGWGGYILVEADDPDAFGRYVAHHNQTYGHVVNVTWEPLFDMDKAFEDVIGNLR
jgi:hypothetical protein